MPDHKLLDVKEEIWSGDDIAGVLDMSLTRVYQLCKTNVLHREGPNKFRVGATIRAYVQHLRGAKGDKDGLTNPVAKSKAKLIEARATTAQIEADLKTGKVAKIEEFETAWTSTLERLRLRLLSIPSKLAPLVAVEDDAAACQELVEAMVYEALEELTSADVESEGEPRGRGRPAKVPQAPEAAGEDDDLGVGGREAETESGG